MVEVAAGVAGPFCGRMLAAFGADVVKVEKAPDGDWTRCADPMLPDAPRSESSTLFLHLNMGKRSVIIDLSTDEGRTQFLQLLESADVLIEDWSSETRSEMGLETILSANPRLVDLSLTPFGTTGPYSGWRTTPLVSLALGGFLYLSGDEDREPLMIPGYQSEYLAGLHAYGGALIALWDRDATDAGLTVEVSEIESLAALHQFTTVMHTYGGVVRSRHGARWENKGGYGRYPITVLPCKDGYVSYAVSTEGQWELLLPMVGRPELLKDPRFATFVERRQHADDIDSILIDWMKDKTRDEVFKLAAGSWSEPASPLLDLSEALSDSQLRHRELFTEVDHPDTGLLTYPTVPFRMSLTQPEFRRAPRLGEHTAEALRSLRTPPPTPAQGLCPTLIESTDPHQDSPPPRRERPGVSVTSSPNIQKDFPRRERIGVRSAASSRPLEDIRVVDLTRVWAGPLATRILADFGAQVIKISDPRVPLDRTSGTNNKLNRNKSSLALRLDQPAGREVFLELTATADVVVENFRPRVMRNFRLTYDELREVRPDIVMCSMPGFGTTGEYRDYPAFGPSVEAMTGLPSMMGYEGGPPRTSALAFPDPVASLNAVAAIMSALRHRRLTGEGQFIDLALIEGPICQIGEHIAAHSRTGHQPARRGNSHPIHAPYGVYPARGDDEWVAICVTSNAEWRRLCRLMNMPDLGFNLMYREPSVRQRHRAEVDAIVSAWSRGLYAEEIARTLQAEGIAAGRVAKNHQLLADPHLNQRGFYVELEEPDVGRKRYPGQAIRVDGVPQSGWTPSARLGEHSHPDSPRAPGVALRRHYGPRTSRDHRRILRNMR